MVEKWLSKNAFIVKWEMERDEKRFLHFYSNNKICIFFCFYNFKIDETISLSFSSIFWSIDRKYLKYMTSQI